MLDKLVEKLMENAASAYMPRLEEIAGARAAELELTKSKIRANPEEVEAWFDKEIAKVGRIDIESLVSKFGSKNATAGI